MKKKLLIITGLLFLLAAGIITAPLLLESQKVQEQVLKRINSCYIVDASVEDLKFTWFPLPHLTAKRIEVHHEGFTVASPLATLYPSWKIFFNLSSLGSLHLTDPVFQLHKISPADPKNGLQTISLPNIKTHIENGTLFLPAYQSSIFASQEISLKNISTTLSIHGKTGEFSGECTASFAKKITFSGEFKGNGRGTLKGEIEGLRPQKILTDKEDTLLSPLEDLNNISFVGSKNSTGFNIDLAGDIPDFSLTHLGTKEKFRLGRGQINLTFGPQNSFSILIKDLLVSDPLLQLQGEISRYFPGNKEQAHIKIDLKAKDIDLTAVRQKVLTLVGEHPVTKHVCDIVQRGKAHSASYFFDAPPSAFAHISSMTIKVDLADTDIHLATIPLDLTKSIGPILIKDGDLTGKNITTWVGDAKGTNGVFLVGLTHDQHGLEVDVDIDANLEELPAVLRSFLENKNVVHELGMVQGQGRANGHLHIGNTLHDFKVRVDVDKFQEADLRYDRLSWPLRLESGTLQVTGTSFSWNAIKGKLGSHFIQETSGTATWEEASIPLTIRSVHGLFDANALLGELQQYPVLADAFSGVIDAIQGSVEVTGSLNGPFFTPKEYTYSFDTKIKDITFQTPVLPKKIMIAKGRGTISDQGIQNLSTSGTVFEKPLLVNGELTHHHWHSWQGDLEIYGVLGENLFTWLTKKGVYPRLIPPRPPYRVTGMDIKWRDKLFNLTGELLSSDETTTLDLDIKDKDKSFAGNFRVKNSTDDAAFSLFWNSATETFSSSFKGTLSGKSLHALMDDSKASIESIRGDFDIKKRKDKKTKKTFFDFSGDLLGRDIHLTWDKGKNVLSIPTLDLAAKKSLMKLRKLEADFNNESITATGSFSSKPGSGHLELNLDSPPSLTTPNIEKFYDNLDHFLHSTLALKEDPEQPSTYEISGFLNFNLADIILPFGAKGEKPPEQHSYRLPFTPLHGTYQFNKTDSELKLSKSQVCGVGVDGLLSWHGPKETSKKITLSTPPDRPLKFEDFLSCFHFDNVIEGPLKISGHIDSDTKICKRGGLIVSSEKGSIKKFVALAKTLSLINITGLSGAIWTEGFYYNKLEVSGNICDNIFTIEKAFIDGDGVDVVATGDINLSTMEYDLTFFVVPFATINGLVTKVPLIGRVLGGKAERIVSVPVKVTGPLNDPIITALSPSAIGEATGKWILDTITLPFDWMIPDKPDTGTKQDPALDQGPQESIPTATPSTTTIK